jgi:hypothetical protein
MKIKTSLHIQQAISQDFLNLFNRFYLQPNLSYVKFLEIWKEGQYSFLFSFEIKHGKKKLQFWSYLQLLAYEVFQFLCNERYWSTSSSSSSSSSSVVSRNTLLTSVASPVVRVFLSHIFVIYCLYTVYISQIHRSGSTKSLESIRPIRVTVIFHDLLSFHLKLSNSLLKSFSHFTFVNDCHQLLSFLLSSPSSAESNPSIYSPLLLSSSLGPSGEFSFRLALNSSSDQEAIKVRFDDWRNDVDSFFFGSIHTNETIQFSAINAFSALSEIFILQEGVVPAILLATVDSSSVSVNYSSSQGAVSPVASLSSALFPSIGERRQEQLLKIEAKNEKRKLYLLFRLQKLKEKIYKTNRVTREDFYRWYGGDQEKLHFEKGQEKGESSSTSLPVDADSSVNSDSKSDDSAWLNRRNGVEEEKKPARKMLQNIVKSSAVAANDEKISFIDDKDYMDCLMNEMINDKRDSDRGALNTSGSVIPQIEHEEVSSDTVSDLQFHEAESLLNQLNNAVDEIMKPSSEVATDFKMQKNREILANYKNHETPQRKGTVGEEPAVSSSEMARLELLVRELNGAVDQILGTNKQEIMDDVSRVKHRGRSTVKRKQFAGNNDGVGAKKVRQSRKAKNVNPVISNDCSVIATSSDSTNFQEFDILVLLSDLEETSANILSSSSFLP